MVPDATPDELFGAWPVNFVGAYDAASFLETRQFSVEATMEGALVGGYRIWQRGDVGVTTMSRVAGRLHWVGMTRLGWGMCWRLIRRR